MKVSSQVWVWVLVIATLAILGISASESNCKFQTGDAKGGSEIWMGYFARELCIETCLIRKRDVDDTINGITVYANKDGCWCASGMTYRDDSAKYMSCYLDAPDPHPDEKCALYYGDAKGGDQIYIGTLTRSECIDACIKRKNEKDDSINGMTVYADENSKGCYCDKSMTYRTDNKKWKSCLLKVPDVHANEKCAMLTGDGKGGSEVWVGYLTKSECIDACTKRKAEGDDLINGITMYSSSDKGCWCEKGMTYRHENTKYTSCFLRVPDANANKQCILYPGDGEGGANTWIGYLTRSECIAACVERKATLDDSINGVTVYANEATKGCYCEKGMTYRDTHTKWKSCILRESATILASGLCEVNVELRKECGPAGITKAQCESRGCCFNSNFVESIWCFYKAKANNKCSVNPENRKECGPAGITKEQCEAKPGCCFNDKTPGTRWCYHERIIEEPVNPCLKNNGGCAQECTHTNGVAHCSCKSGYKADGKSCHAVDPCSKNNGGCAQVCTNTNGVAHCSCKDGYNADGASCHKVNPCSKNNGGCAQVCANKNGVAHCSCNEGYKADGNSCHVVLRCNGRDNGCCTKDQPCALGDGDCDGDRECASGLVCGHNNCPWGDQDDCCKKP